MSNRKRTVIVHSIASTGAFIGYLLNLPIGILIGSFMAVGVAQVLGLGASPFKKRNRQFVQMAIGGVIGLNMTNDLLPYIVELLIPGIFAAVIHLLFAFLFALILTKYFRFDWATAFCGCIPAGMSEASTTANGVGADVQVVMLMHLFRVSILITFLPLLLSYL